MLAGVVATGTGGCSRTTRSTPHQPESNGVVERFNEIIIDEARCLLLQSGLPGRYWHYACRAFLLARNACVKGTDGRTAWDRRFGKEFHGKLLPFGSKVPAAEARRREVRAERLGGHHARPSSRASWPLQRRPAGLEPRQPLSRGPPEVYHSPRE